MIYSDEQIELCRRTDGPNEPRRIPGPRLLAAAVIFAAVAVLFSIGWLISVV